MSATTKRFSSRTVLLVVSGLILLAVAAVLVPREWGARAGRAAGPPEQVTIAVNAEYVGTCPVAVAQANGYFAQEGVTAVFQRHNSGKAALDATLVGKADLATTADIPVMFAAVNKVPVSVIATIFKTEMDHGIVGQRNHGIAAPGSLKGKRIGVTMGTSGHFVLNAFLNHQRLTANDVTMVNLQPDEFAAALQHGGIDAVSTWEPFLDNLRIQLGGNGVVFYGEDVYEIPYNIAGKRAFIAQHPELMKKIVRALIQGARFCKSEAEAARTIMGAVLQVDTSKWATRWHTYRFNVALDQGLILSLEDEARWALSNQLAGAGTMPNFLDYLYLDALTAVDPAAVTVIH